MHTVSGDVPVQRSVLPEGEAGVDATVKQMAKLAHSRWGSKSPKIRALAMNIINKARVPDKDYYGEIVAIHNWVRDNIRYFRDPLGQETLADPEQTAFNLRGGDCLAAGTRVLTKTVTKPIEQVVVGDVIVGRTGWAHVLKWWDKGVLPTLLIYLSNDTIINCTADHKFFLHNGAEKKASALVVGDSLLAAPAVIPTHKTINHVIKIEVGEEKHVYDIATSDQGIYLPDNDVVVHNCDDLSTLEIALLGAVGIKSYPVVCGVLPGTFSHVYVHAEVPRGTHPASGKIIALDPIMKQWPAGREAANLASKKTYPQYAHPMGAAMSGLGSYAVGPSYLDTEHSHATELLAPDHSFTRRDRTLASTAQATVPMDGMDALMGPSSLPPTGGAFTPTSAGDGGTIVKQNGQLVPRGFLRDEPTAAEIMEMHPATRKELGPLGPIFEYRAEGEHEGLKDSKPKRLPTLARSLRGRGLPVAAIPTETGGKTYELTPIQQVLRSQDLTAKPYATEFLKKQKIVTLRARRPEVLYSKPKTLQQGVDLGEELIAQTKAQIQTAQAQLPGSPLAKKERLTAKIAQQHRMLDQIEARVLRLRQMLREKEPAAAKNTVRAASVRAQENMTNAFPINGMGAFDTSSVVGAVKNPMVYVPALAVVGFFLVRKLMARRA